MKEGSQVDLLRRIKEITEDDDRMSRGAVEMFTATCELLGRRKPVVEDYVANWLVASVRAVIDGMIALSWKSEGLDVDVKRLETIIVSLAGDPRSMNLQPVETARLLDNVNVAYSYYELETGRRPKLCNFRCVEEYDVFFSFIRFTARWLIKQLVLSTEPADVPSA